MANNCPVCLANIDIVGRVHRCVRVMEQKLPNVAVPDSSGPRTYKYRNTDKCRGAVPTVNPVPREAAPASVRGGGTYQYRNADARREYMANYMRGYRRKQKES